MVSGTDEHGTPIQVQADKEGVVHARAGRPLQPRHRRGPAPGSGCPTTCSPARRRATTTPSCRSCSRSLHQATATSFTKHDDGRDLAVDRSHAARPLHRGHLPDLRLRRCARRPVRQLRQPARPDRPDQPALAGSTGRRRSSSRPSTSSSTCRPSPNALRHLAGRAHRLAAERPAVLARTWSTTCSRAPISRDLDWGVPIPLDGWARPHRQAPLRVVRRGDRLPVGVDRVGAPHRRPRRLAALVAETRTRVSYYFMGKDNIVFHSVIWPSILLGYDGQG